MATKKIQPKRAAKQAAAVLVTRAEAARILGRSMTVLRRMETEGSIECQIRRGVHVFERTHVERVAAKLPKLAPRTTPAAPLSAGARAAAAFALLGKGRDWRALVSELQIAPDEAQALAAGYVQPGDVSLAPDVVDELRALMGGVDVTGASILESFKRLRAVVRAARAAGFLPRGERQSDEQPRRHRELAS